MEQKIFRQNEQNEEVISCQTNKADTLYKFVMNRDREIILICRT